MEALNVDVMNSRQQQQQQALCPLTGCPVELPFAGKWPVLIPSDLKAS